MKYGESIFDVFYLIFAICMGIAILVRHKSRTGQLIGWAVLILGCGDAFHLVPRVLNYFIERDFSAWLGVGKLVTSISMTVFYLLIYRVWVRLFGPEKKALSIVFYVLVGARVILCLLPQNRWLENEGSVLWGIIRNIPFVAIGVIVICLYFSTHKQIRGLRRVWILVLLSFLFYIPVAVAASLVPMLGMLMLPKTICYIWLIWDFWRFLKSGDR